MQFLLADHYFKRYEDVTVEILMQNGVKLLLCDLDNTLKIRKDVLPIPKLVDWVNDLKKHKIKVVIISNNARKNKIQRFSRALGVDCVWFAKKPMSTKLTQVMQKYGFSNKETVMLGDKWWTDILAARFAGVRGWQVEHRVNVLKEVE